MLGQRQLAGLQGPIAGVLGKVGQSQVWAFAGLPQGQQHYTWPGRAGLSWPLMGLTDLHRNSPRRKNGNVDRYSPGAASRVPDSQAPARGQTGSCCQVCMFQRISNGQEGQGICWGGRKKSTSRVPKCHTPARSQTDSCCPGVHASKDQQQPGRSGHCWGGRNNLAGTKG